MNLNTQTNGAQNVPATDNKDAKTGPVPEASPDSVPMFPAESDNTKLDLASPTEAASSMLSPMPDEATEDMSGFAGEVVTGEDEARRKHSAKTEVSTVAVSTVKEVFAPVDVAPIVNKGVGGFQIDVPQLPLSPLNPDVPGMYMIGMDEMIASPIDYLARALDFYWDRGAYHGANPLETGATEDGFTLWPTGHAYDRKLGNTYPLEQMLDLAEKKGISPLMEWTLHKVSDFRPAIGKASRSGSSGPTRSHVPSSPPFQWETARTWSYFDENGVELFQVGRCDFPQGKAIRQRCRAQSGGWSYSMENVRRVLYSLRNVLKAQIVLFVEGEKAADSLNRHLATVNRLGEMVATTTSMGAGKAHKTEFGDVVAAKTVIVFPDNDEPGKRHADDICRLCASAAVIKRVTLPNLPPKGDVADYLAGGGTIEEVLSLIENAAPWSPSEGYTGDPSVVGSELALSAPPPSEAPKATGASESAGNNGAAQPNAVNAAPLHAAPSGATLNGAAPNSPTKRFPLYSLQELYLWPDPAWLIKDFLVRGTTSLLTAKQASYKSFFALSMGLCVASGKEWYGHKVEQGNVLFIAAEGAVGVRKCAAAWLEFHNIEEVPTNFLVHPDPIQVGDTSNVKALVREVADFKPSLIIVDTLARCAVNLDENSVRDMGLFIVGIDLMAKALNCHVLVVHHNNKTGAYRGSSSLPAAVDAHFSLERKDKDIFLKTEKQKDAAEAPVMSFEIRPVFFQFPNMPGVEMNSIVLVRTDTVSEPTQFNLTPLERRTLEVLFDVFINEGASAVEWERACKSSGIQDSTHRRTRRKLLDLGFAHIKDKGGNLINHSQYSDLIPAERTKARFYPDQGEATLFEITRRASSSQHSTSFDSCGQTPASDTSEQAGQDLQKDDARFPSSSGAEIDLNEFLNGQS